MTQMRQSTETTTELESILQQDMGGEGGPKRAEDFRNTDLLDADDIIGHYIQDAAG